MIQINLLGSVTLLRDGEPFRLERRAQRLLMGLLALDAGRRVSSSHLIEMLWGADAPASARATLHTRISELRSLLGRRGMGNGAAGLRSVETGYCLEIEPDQVDSHRFLELAGGWRRLPCPQDSLDRLAAALELWRGPVFGGLLPESTSAAVEALTAARLTALEDYFALSLRLGNNLQVVDRLTEAARGNPTRERLTALCMAALAQAGRAAEALALYADWRAWLRDELGTDPAAEVQQVYLAIVRSDDLTGLAVLGSHPLPVIESGAPQGAKPDVNKLPPNRPATGSAGAPEPETGAGEPGGAQPPAHSVPVAPRTLPPPVDGFTGREAQIAQLVELVTGAHQRLVAVSGAAGVGKTALAVHVAHRVARHFPDGHLFADLRGHDEQQPPETPYGVLGRLLRALGVPAGAVPEQFDARVDAYRQLLADRRLLLILDGVADDEQVAPLLAAGDSCRIVLTGRTRLGAAAGAAQLVVRTMGEAEAISLLRRIAGDARVAADPGGAAELIRRCGGLPLALRIAGAKLATKPHWSIAHLVDLLAVDATRLSYLTHQQLSVASGIATSCRTLSAPAWSLLRLAGALEAPGIAVWMAAALLGADARTGECALEELFDANLAEVAEGAGRSAPHYVISPLVSDFARERAAAELGRDQLHEARQRVHEACADTVSTTPRRSHGAVTSNGATSNGATSDSAVSRGVSINSSLISNILTSGALPARAAARRPAGGCAPRPGEDLRAGPPGWFDREFAAITAAAPAHPPGDPHGTARSGATQPACTAPSR